MESKKLESKLKLLMKFRPIPEDMKLKPCPFCGHNAIMWMGDGGDYYNDFHVNCGNMDCGGECNTGSWSIRSPNPDDVLKVKYETILSWNRRVNNK